MTKGPGDEVGFIGTKLLSYRAVPNHNNMKPMHNTGFGEFSFYFHAFEYIRSLNEKFDVRINVYFFVTPLSN